MPAASRCTPGSIHSARFPTTRSKSLGNPHHPLDAAHHQALWLMTWCDPGHPETRARALSVIMDVVRRYDIDGVHLDDYFYPYPSGGLKFNDGKSPAQRRSYVDGFVSSLYSSVKARKPWVRVGISPFGIWRPGVPSGIEAGIDSYEQLAGDSRKWLKNGWVDYLAPQLYWRISPQKQSFPKLLEWWRQQGSRPGLAGHRHRAHQFLRRPRSPRIRDHQPDRPHPEDRQKLERPHPLERQKPGHQPRRHRQHARRDLHPARRRAADAMAQQARPGRTRRQRFRSAARKHDVRWQPDGNTARIAVQARNGGTWRTMKIAREIRAGDHSPRRCHRGDRARPLRKCQPAQGARASLTQQCRGDRNRSRESQDLHHQSQGWIRPVHPLLEGRRAAEDPHLRLHGRGQDDRPADHRPADKTAGSADEVTTRATRVAPPL
jgi:hypothetical protein